MRNDFKMIVFKQLTIFIKTQNDITKSKLHVAGINKMLRYMLNITINTVGTLNLSTEFGILLFFSAFIETLDFFSRNTSSILHVEYKAL
jgi:hypothetical protein